MMTIRKQRPPLHSQIRRIAFAVAALAMTLGAPLAARADDDWHHGHHGHGHWHGRGWAPYYVAPRYYGPRFYGPPVVYAPGPAFYPAPPVYVAPAPVYVAPPPYAYYDGRPHVGVSFGFGWTAH
jgi:hypothetical protein